MTTQPWSLEVFADFHQFVVADADADWSALADGWADPANVERMFVQGSGFVGIGTARNMSTPVTLSVIDHSPGAPPTDVDRVNDGEIDIPSGVLTVFGVSEYAPDHRRIEITPGSYGLRVIYRSLDRLSGNGLDGEDTYEVLLWPTNVT